MVQPYSIENHLPLETGFKAALELVCHKLKCQPDDVRLLGYTLLGLSFEGYQRVGLVMEKTPVDISYQELDEYWNRSGEYYNTEKRVDALPST